MCVLWARRRVNEKNEEQDLCSGSVFRQREGMQTSSLDSLTFKSCLNCFNLLSLEIQANRENLAVLLLGTFDTGVVFCYWRHFILGLSVANLSFWSYFSVLWAIYCIVWLRIVFGM